MRIFKKAYRAANGEERQYKSWVIEVRDVRGRAVRFAGYADWRLSEALARRIEGLITAKRAGEPLTADLAGWLDGTSPALRARLCKMGLVTATRAGRGEPLEAWLIGFLDSLRTGGRSERHLHDMERILRRLFSECGWLTWADVSLDRLEQYLRGRTAEGRSARTRNLCLARFKQFCRWLDDRELVTPLRGLGRIGFLNERADRRKQRRALTAEELVRLFDAARRRPLLEAQRLNRGGRPKLKPETVAMLNRQGEARALVYELAYQTGLRRKELAAVCVRDLDLGERPRVTLPAEKTKNRQAASLPLRADMAERLRRFIAERGLRPADAVFLVPTLRVFYGDCKLAGIALTDESGRSVDFHSMRTTLSTHLLAAGTPVRTAMEILRHSRASLTLETYMDARLLDTRGAVDALPDLGAGSKKADAKRAG